MAAGAWYTTRAFPLAAAGGGQELLTVAGAVESRARPITPENPIPRRIYSTSPQYPFEAAAVDAHGVVTLKVTLGESGRVAELRRAGFVGGSDRPPANVALELRGDPMGPVTEASIRRAKPLSHTTMPAGATQLAGAVEALFRAAADGVAQWQYDPPANGPISFYLQIAFRPGLDATLVAQDPVLSPARVALFLPAPRPPAGLIGDTRAGAPPPPTAPPPAPPPPSGVDRAPAPIRVGRNIAPPVKTKDARPVYPAIARTAKVQGVVILELSVDADGRVSESRVIRSLPLLDQAALDAVRQWEFTPTLLNGVPTPIIMTVTVNFTLAESPDPAP
jgi:TonB family protein